MGQWSSRSFSVFWRYNTTDADSSIRGDIIPRLRKQDPLSYLQSGGSDGSGSARRDVPKIESMWRLKEYRDCTTSSLVPNKVRASSLVPNKGSASSPPPVWLFASEGESSRGESNLDLDLDLDLDFDLESSKDESKNPLRHLLRRLDTTIRSGGSGGSGGFLGTESRLAESALQRVLDCSGEIARALVRSHDNTMPFGSLDMLEWMDILEAIRRKSPICEYRGLDWEPIEELLIGAVRAQ